METMKPPYEFTDFLIYNAVIDEVETTYLKTFEEELVLYLENGNPNNFEPFEKVTQIIMYKNYLAGIITAIKHLEKVNFVFREDVSPELIYSKFRRDFDLIEKILKILDKPYQEQTKNWSFEKIAEKSAEILKNPIFYKWAGFI